MDIVEALDAEGSVAVVGAGGKKTTCYELARRVGRAVVTATVRIPIFDRTVAEVVVTDEPAAAVRRADRWPLGIVRDREREDRYRGFDPADADDLIAAAADRDVGVLIKADGARTRWLKAPDEREPQIPTAVETVVPIASARVVGEPLTEERVHRPERVAAATDLDPGDEIDPAAVAAVVASEDGGLKDVPPDATPVPLVNMVDDDELEATARKIAAEIHARADVPRVVLARMIDDDPLVDVVE